jgi:hypothetical protein
MNENIILKNNPKTEFQLQENGFKLIDKETEQNTGFYTYNDIHAIELNKVWFPRLITWLRYTTWIFNGGVPMVGEGPWKKSNLIINIGKRKIKIWLTDSDMANKAKKLVDLLNLQTKHNMML